MYSLIGILFCILEGILVAKFGWIALLWSPIGFFVGLFASANTLLPILMGAPKAASLVSKNEMKPTVFLALIWAPIIWFSVFFLLRWLFPSAYSWVINNETLTIGFLFGVGAILLSPFFKKSRDDFRSDFDKSYGRYYVDQSNFSLGFTDAKNQKQLKQIQATITVSSNLYLHDFSSSFDELDFKYPNSRFRCMIFCLTTVIKCCEDLIASPELLQKECLHFLSTFTTSKDSVKEFFGQITTAEQAEITGNVYLDEYSKKWDTYYDYIGSDNKEKATDILCSMIHSIGTDRQMEIADKDRLSQLSWQLQFSLDNGTMKGAFNDLLSK